MKRLSIFAASACLVAAANADTFTWTDSFQGPTAFTDITQTGNLKFFDSSKGHLDHIALTLTGGISGSIVFKNNSGAAVDVGGAISTDFGFSSLSAIGGTIFGSGFSTGYDTNGLQHIEAQGTYDSGLKQDAGSVSFNLDAFLNDLQGAGGLFDISCQSHTGFAGGGVTQVTTTLSNKGHCGATVVYTYSADANQTPEPGSLALVGLAMAGLAVRARRPKAQSV